MCSTVPVRAVKVIVLNLRSLANELVSVPAAGAGRACIAGVEDFFRYHIQWRLE